LCSLLCDFPLVGVVSSLRHERRLDVREHFRKSGKRRKRNELIVENPVSKPAIFLP
jgi:hypothetical protein